MEKKYIDGLVSIIMPAYNAEKNISYAIDSIISQTYKYWELVVVNDCSTDNTLKIVEEKYSKEDRIKIYTLDKNSGVAKARNYGFDQAEGRYLAFLDTDDIWEKEKLSKQIDFMQNEGHYFTCTQYKIIDENGKLTEKKYIPPKEITFDKQLRGSRIGCLTVVIDRYITGEFYMPNLGHEDYLTWVNLIREFGPVYTLEQPLGYYRLSEKGISSNKFKAAKWQYLIYRKNLGLGILKSIYYFMNYSIRGLFKYD